MPFNLKEYSRRYYLANREKILARSHAKRVSNPDASREYFRIYAAANRDRLRDQSRIRQRALRAAWTQEQHEQFLRVDRERARKRYAANPDKYRRKTDSAKRRHAESVKAHYASNPEYARMIRERNKSRYHKDKDKYRAENRARAKTERGYENARRGRARDRDLRPELVACRSMLKRILHRARAAKTGRTHDMLGYSALELRRHIEQQFHDGMTWENWTKVWQLDHIREVALFTDEGVTDPAVVNALTNLQPLLLEDHRVKTEKFVSSYRRKDAA